MIELADRDGRLRRKHRRGGCPGAGRHSQTPDQLAAIHFAELKAPKQIFDEMFHCRVLLGPNSEAQTAGAT
jgi:hypothetical protein